MDIPTLVSIIMGGLSLIAQGIFCIMIFLWKRSDKSKDDERTTRNESIVAKLNDQKSLSSNILRALNKQLEKIHELDKQLMVIKESLKTYVTKEECFSFRQKKLCNYEVSKDEKD